MCVGDSKPARGLRLQWPLMEGDRSRGDDACAQAAAAVVTQSGDRAWTARGAGRPWTRAAMLRPSEASVGRSVRAVTAAAGKASSLAFAGAGSVSSGTSATVPGETSAQPALRGPEGAGAGAGDGANAGAGAAG